MSAPKPKPQLDPAFRLETLNVLVVDDNDHMRVIVGEVLRAIGVRKVHHARNGWEALEQIRNVNPTTVITDWNMEPLSGIELVQMIRRAPDLPNRAVPMILLTGNTSRNQVIEARGCGVDEFLAKPVSAQALISRLEEVTLRRRPFVESATYAGPCRRRNRSEDFRGPFRRATDAVNQPGAQLVRTDPETIAMQKALRVIKMIADKLTNENKSEIGLLIEMIGDLAPLQSALKDSHVDRLIASLQRYIAGTGASGRMDLGVVRTHIGASLQVLTLPLARVTERDMVVSGLETVVERRLHVYG